MRRYIPYRPLGRRFLRPAAAARRSLPPASSIQHPVSRSAFSPQPSAFTLSAAAFSIAGFRYYDGAEALPELRPGMPLTLRSEPANPHDPWAVEILHGPAKLGYVPRFCNRQLSRLLQTGDPPTCEVAHVSTDAPPWEAVAVRVSLNQPELQAA